MNVAPDEGEFQGTDRFQVMGTLGYGASGTVYDAFDRIRQIPVALKMLTKLDAEARYRFKREFRSMTSVHHENLVELYDLMADGQAWFFTMERVVGQELLPFVRGSSTKRKEVAQTGIFTAETIRGDEPIGEIGLPKDLGRLRGTFTQLCSGLAALHSAGLLHRDVKPSNVLVTAQGRVVLVDFGIVAELRDPISRSTDLTAFVGTPSYMAPEQGCGEAVNAACDWYAVGVLLFECLTGRLPFDDVGLEALTTKLERDAPHARDFGPAVPADLDALCAELLSRDPASRPDGAEIVRRLAHAVSVLPPAVNEATEASPFMGRDAQLAALDSAFRQVRPGQPVIVHVPGTSGMGKSTLVRHFLDRVATNDQAIVLASRCCEREAVLFKALDDVVDGLAAYLVAADRDESMPRLAPADAIALVQMFPVLARVPALADVTEHAKRGAGDAAASIARRARAFAALRTMLAHLTKQAPVVLAIDDAQWGDEDSAGLLADLVAPPDPPAMLIVFAYRREWAGRAPLLIARPAGAGVNVPVHTVAVDPLAETEARKLACFWLGHDEIDSAAVDAIVAEAQGSPFYIMEFARHVRAAGIPTAGLNLGTVLRARFAKLAPAPRMLLETLSVAARPLELPLATRAAGLMPEHAVEALRTLRVAHLIRESDDGGVARAETFHDRMREALVGTMSEDDLRARHGQFVDALDALNLPDAESLYVHCRGAGLISRAAANAALAAGHAMRSAAFVRAAELFAAALELTPADERAQPWRVARAEALACAGQRRTAAEAYLSAAGSAATREEARILERIAVGQFIKGGYFDVGVPLAERLLAELGLPLAPTRTRAIASLLARLAWFRIRGLRGMVERPASSVAPETLAMLDAGIELGSGLNACDELRGSELLSRVSVRAIAAGEPRRLSQALFSFAVMVSADGDSPYARYLLDQAMAIAQRCGDPGQIANVQMGLGVSNAFGGRWRASYTVLREAEKYWVTESNLTHWDRDLGAAVLVLDLYQLGQIREMCRRVPAIIADAVQREDRYIRAIVGNSPGSMCWLVADQPETHVQVAHSSITGEPRKGVLRGEHVNYGLNLAHNDLYVGEPLRAASRLDTLSVQARWSPAMAMMLTRGQFSDVRARAALAAACAGHDPRENRRHALRLAKTFERSRLPWLHAMAVMIRAGEADAARRADDAVGLYERAARAFDAIEMVLHATVARRRHGEWLGGDLGRALVRDADGWMTEQGIVRPERFAAMLAPTSFR